MWIYWAVNQNSPVRGFSPSLIQARQVGRSSIALQPLSPTSFSWPLIVPFNKKACAWRTVPGLPLGDHVITNIVALGETQPPRFCIPMTKFPPQHPSWGASHRHKELLGQFWLSWILQCVVPIWSNLPLLRLEKSQERTHDDRERLLCHCDWGRFPLGLCPCLWVQRAETRWPPWSRWALQ